MMHWYLKTFFCTSIQFVQIVIHSDRLCILSMWLRDYFVSFGKILEVLYILITPSLCQSSLQIYWWTSGETAPTTGQHVTTSSSNRARKETRKFDNSYSYICITLKVLIFWTRIISLCIINPHSIRYRTFTNLNIDKFFLYNYR